jgi:hypothetical protein
LPSVARAVPAVRGALTVCAGLTGWAAALEDIAPVAAMAATANAGALAAMVNRVVVRFSDLRRDKVNFRPGTLFRALKQHPLTARIGSCVRARRRFKATRWLRFVTRHVRGVL